MSAPVQFEIPQSIHDEFDAKLEALENRFVRETFHKTCSNLQELLGLVAEKQQDMVLQLLSPAGQQNLTVSGKIKSVSSDFVELLTPDEIDDVIVIPINSIIFIRLVNAEADKIMQEKQQSIQQAFNEFQMEAAEEAKRRNQASNLVVARGVPDNVKLQG